MQSLLTFVGKHMKYLLILILILSLPKSLLANGLTAYNCFHNGEFYITTTELYTCPPPPDFIPTLDEIANGKVPHSHSQQGYVMPYKTTRHDPDCILYKQGIGSPQVL